jgi:hypothetical protein
MNRNKGKMTGFAPVRNEAIRKRNDPVLKRNDHQSVNGSELLAQIPFSHKLTILLNVPEAVQVTWHDATLLQIALKDRSSTYEEPRSFVTVLRMISRADSISCDVVSRETLKRTPP